jgi:hypothetical protein
MSGTTVRKVISYITGQIDLPSNPPNGFKAKPMVKVNNADAEVESQQHGRWRYLAIVEPGEYRVVVTLGLVSAAASIAILEGETVEQDFLFTTSQGNQFQ